MTMRYSNVLKRYVKLATSGIRINLNALVSHNLVLNNKFIIFRLKLVSTNVNQTILISSSMIAVPAYLKNLIIIQLPDSVLNLLVRLVRNGILLY